MSRKEGRGNGAADSWDKVEYTTLTHTAQASNRQHHLYIVSHVLSYSTVDNSSASISSLLICNHSLDHYTLQRALQKAMLNLLIQQIVQASCVADIQHTLLKCMCITMPVSTYHAEQISVPGQYK